MIWPDEDPLPTRRVVAYSLRVAISHSDSLRSNIGLEVYLQTMLAGGFISMGSDLIGMVRSLLVGTTIGTRMRAHISLTPQHFHRTGAAAPSSTDASSDAIALKDAQVTEGEARRSEDRKSTRLNSSHSGESRMPSSA